MPSTIYFVLGMVFYFQKKSEKKLVFVFILWHSLRMNLIEALWQTTRLAEIYGAKMDVDLIHRKTVIVTLPDGVDKNLVSCFCSELINWGLFGAWQLDSKENVIVIDPRLK